MWRALYDKNVWASKCTSPQLWQKAKDFIIRPIIRKAHFTHSKTFWNRNASYDHGVWKSMYGCALSLSVVHNITMQLTTNETLHSGKQKGCGVCAIPPCPHLLPIPEKNLWTRSGPMLEIPPIWKSKAAAVSGRHTLTTLEKMRSTHALRQKRTARCDLQDQNPNMGSPSLQSF